MLGVLATLGTPGLHLVHQPLAVNQAQSELCLKLLLSRKGFKEWLCAALRTCDKGYMSLADYTIQPIQRIMR